MSRKLLELVDLCVDRVKIYNEDLGDLMSHMCCVKEKRWTIAQCCEHNYFKSLK